MDMHELRALLRLATHGAVPAGVLHMIEARRIFRNRGYADVTFQAAWRAWVAHVHLVPSYVDLRTAFVVDVGANHGQFSSAVLGLASTACVLAAEPNPVALARLQARLGAHPNVDLRGVAVSSATGTAIFHLTAHDHNASLKIPLHAMSDVIDEGWESAGDIEVQTITLDELANGRPVDVLKIDVQGSEMDVLAGGNRTLADARCVLLELNLIPQYEGDAQFNTIHAEMERRGFTLVSVSPALHAKDGTAIFVDGCYVPRQ